MSRGKLVLSVAIALLVCLAAGYVWGASGRGAIQTSLDEARQHLDVAEARGHILDARVSLYNINFGDASRHFEEAKTPLRRVKERYQGARQSDAAGRIDAALSLVEEAQRLSGKLDPTANAKAGEALDAIKVAVDRR
jgi:hypothetical protein